MIMAMGRWSSTAAPRVRVSWTLITYSHVQVLVRYMRYKFVGSTKLDSGMWSRCEGLIPRTRTTQVVGAVAAGARW